VGQHSSASVSRLLGLDGFQLVSAELVSGEWQLAVQTTATVVGCVGCGVRATPHGPGARPADRWPAGGAGLAQAHLALSGAGLCGPDLDRAGGRHPLFGRC
jgi:hypothetical protein